MINNCDDEDDYDDDDNGDDDIHDGDSTSNIASDWTLYL